MYYILGILYTWPVPIITCHIFFFWSDLFKDSESWTSFYREIQIIFGKLWLWSYQDQRYSSRLWINVFQSASSDDVNARNEGGFDKPISRPFFEEANPAQSIHKHCRHSEKASGTLFQVLKLRSLTLCLEQYAHWHGFFYLVMQYIWYVCSNKFKTGIQWRLQHCLATGVGKFLDSPPLWEKWPMWIILSEY